MKFIDTHSHIYDTKFQNDIEAILARCQEQKVETIYMPNIDHSSIDAMLELEQKYTQCIAMMGLHPCSVDKNFQKELYIVEEWLNKRDFVAVGEIGLDLYWDKTFFEQQKEALSIQINWAKKFKRPIVIHSRNSTSEVLEILRQHKDDDLQGIFHCFGGTQEEAEQIIELGFYLGIGGVLTFKNSKLDKVVENIDLKHLVLETDSPYLAPVPYRGKRNESTYIPLIAEKLATVKQMSLEEVALQTSQNAEKIFVHN
jgi:TatD DNase family protein